MIFSMCVGCRKMFSKKSASIRRKPPVTPDPLESHPGPMLLTAAKLSQLKKSAGNSCHVVGTSHSCERSRILPDMEEEAHSTNLCNCKAAECQGTAV
jgi:hypothetical protein